MRIFLRASGGGWQISLQKDSAGVWGTEKSSPVNRTPSGAFFGSGFGPGHLPNWAASEQEEKTLKARLDGMPAAQGLTVEWDSNGNCSANIETGSAVIGTSGVRKDPLRAIMEAFDDAASKSAP
jgi:hypothetical protein